MKAPPVRPPALWAPPPALTRAPLPVAATPPQPAAQTPAVFDSEFTEQVHCCWSTENDTETFSDVHC